jgi:hypothetical protein
MSIPKSKKLTDEQKERFAPMLIRTWGAIASDCEHLLSRRGRVGEIIELVCDANLPEMYGGMSSEEYKIILESYHHRDTQKWLRQVLNY